MKQMSLRKVAIATSTLACAALFSFSWSEQRGVSLSVDNAQAQSPGSAFLPSAGQTPGVGYGERRHHHRRAGYGYRPTHYRRAGYGYHPGAAGAAAVGAGLAAGAVGTAVAAGTQPWGWGGGPYDTGTGYYGGGPYYTGSVWGANAYYAPPAASPSPSPASSDAVPWPSQFTCMPGTLVRPGNGIVYRCW